MPDRRNVPTGALLALLRPGALLAAGPRVEAPAADADSAFLNRLTCGGTDPARAALARLGREGWLDAQLARSPSGPQIEARLGSPRLRIA